MHLREDSCLESRNSFQLFSGTPRDNLLQYSCLENSMDRGAWQAAVHRVAKSRAQLSTHVCTHKETAQLVAVFCFLRCSFYSSPDDNTCPLVFRGNYIHVKATINYEDAKSILNLAICASPSLLLFLPSCSTQVGLLATKLQISKSHLPPSSFGIKMSCSLFYFERIPFKEIILQETEQLKQSVPYSPFSIILKFFVEGNLPQGCSRYIMLWEC